jgi:parallel beta-helix repeat protein
MSVKGVLLCFFLVAATLIPAWESPGEPSSTFMSVAIADAHVLRLAPRTNLGERPSLAVDAAPLARSYLRFALPQTFEPTASATLRIHLTKGSSAGVQVYSTGRTWEEGSITFSNAPGPSKLVGSSGPLGRGWANIDITPVVEDLPEFTLILSTSGRKEIRLTSRDGPSSRGLAPKNKPNPNSPTVIIEEPTAQPASPNPPPSPAPSPTVPPTPPPTSCQGVSVVPGSEIQAAVGAHPAGTDFCIGAGVHRVTTPVVPKSGQRFIGEPGAVISGAEVIEIWNRSGPYWYATGQTQGPTVECMSGKSCAEVRFQESIYADDIFYDDVPLTRVLSKERLEPQPTDPAWMTSNRFYFDYAADTVWVNVDPTGHLVEAAIAPGLFKGATSVVDVTVQGLVLEKAAGYGISSNNGTGWTAQNNEVRLNHTKGIRMWAGASILGNHVHHNGQYGVSASDGSGIRVESNEIDHNNAARYQVAGGYWDAGGTKFVRTSGLLLRDNHVHNNVGDGFWLDIQNADATIEGNRLSENERFGLFYEISYQGVVVGNTFTGNDLDAIRVTSSSGVDIARNSVSVSAADPKGGGIRLAQDGRETSGYVLTNVSVHDNLIALCSGTTGASTSYGGNAIFQSRNNRFEGNVYRVGSATSSWWLWMNGKRTWPEWQSYGLDGSGSLQTIAC